MWSDKNHLFLNTNSINPIASILSLCTTCLPLKWKKKYSCSYLGPASSLLLCLQLIPNLYSSTFILQVFPYSPAFALWTYTSPESFLLEYKHISVSTTILKHTDTFYFTFLSSYHPISLLPFTAKFLKEDLSRILSSLPHLSFSNSFQFIFYSWLYTETFLKNFTSILILARANN